jgi:hypothetical protein
MVPRQEGGMVEDWMEGLGGGGDAAVSPGYDEGEAQQTLDTRRSTLDTRH